MQLELGKAPKQLGTERESQRNLKQLQFNSFTLQMRTLRLKKLMIWQSHLARRSQNQDKNSGFLSPAPELGQDLIKSNTRATKVVVPIRIGN